MKTKCTSIIALACCTLFAAAGCKQKAQDDTGNVRTNNADRPEMVSSGIGAKFKVPAGQAAVFEVVTRRGAATVALPPLAAYVVAPTGGAITGTFRFFPESEQTGPDVRRHAWRIELLSGAGNGSVGGLPVPEALEPTVGRLLLDLDLHPGDGVIHWNRSDDTQLPENGIIGLRVTLFAHDQKTGGSGVGHTDWKKSSTTTPP